MGNGYLALSKAGFLAASLAVSSGCDSGASTLQETQIQRAPEARYRVDAARDRIWVLTDDGVSLYDVKAQTRLAIVLPDWVRVDQAYGCLPDLALGPKGEAVITSNVVPTLWAVHPETLAVTTHQLSLDADTDKDVGFSGLAYSAEHGAFFAVSYAHGSLWRIDPQFTRAQKISLAEPIRNACGLAMRARGSQQSIRQPAALCVRTSREVWDVNFGPSQRSAFVAARLRPIIPYPPFSDAPAEASCG